MHPIVMLRGLLLQKKCPRCLVAVKGMALLCTSPEEYWDAVSIFTVIFRVTPFLLIVFLFMPRLLRQEESLHVTWWGLPFTLLDLTLLYPSRVLNVKKHCVKLASRGLCTVVRDIREHIEKQSTL